MVTFGSARTIREPLRPSYQGYFGGISESVSHGEPGAILSFLKTWMEFFAHGPAATRGEGEPSRRPGTPARATSHGPERRFQRVGVPVAASVEPGPAGAVARCRVGARRRPPRPRARPRRTGATPRARRPRAARASRSAPPGRRGPRRGPRAARRDRPSRRDAGPRWSQLPQAHAHVSMPSQSSPTRPRVASARGLGRVVPSHQHPFPSTIFLAISESGSISLCCRTDRFFGSGGPQSAATVKTTRASRPSICGVRRVDTAGSSSP